MATDIFAPGAQLIDIDELVHLHRAEGLSLLAGSPDRRPPGYVKLDDGASVSAAATVLELLRLANLGRELLKPGSAFAIGQWIQRRGRDADDRLLARLQVRPGSEAAVP